MTAYLEETYVFSHLLKGAQQEETSAQLEETAAQQEETSAQLEETAAQQEETNVHNLRRQIAQLEETRVHNLRRRAQLEETICTT
jgi:hypothetical protein